MKAILIKDGKGPAENLYIGEAPKPSLKAGELLVRVKAFGINRADTYQRNGNYPLPPGASEILGVEFSGIVDDIGTTTKYRVGDEIFGLVAGGGYAEYVAAYDTHVWRKPADLTWAEAASIPENWITAYQALKVVGNLEAQDRVLVHAGASGVGVAANQLARYFGSQTVVTTASTTEKLDWLAAIKMGPTHTINYKTQDFAKECAGITEGKGINLIIDFVGKSHWEKNITSLAADGRMVILSTLSGSETQIDLRSILYKRLRIEGSTLRARSLQYQAKLIDGMSERIIHDISGENGDKPLRVFIHKTYPWTEIVEAHREMEVNKNSGKIIVEIL